MAELSDLWWKNAIVYGLDVETFFDSNGDGIGDFRGLASRVDYLATLEIDCLWLLPFYPTPNRDDGYDVSDYYNVDPRLGTLGDFVEFMRLAHENGIRILMDLVVNHTSDQHPWFQSARSDPDSPHRDWYIWREEPPADPGESVFPGSGQQGIWSFDEEAGLYYRHHFYDFQPDLNLANAQVREEIHRIMGFWLELGVSGFRVDAAPYLLYLAEDPEEDPHFYLRQFRAFLNRRGPDAILLGEANLEPDHQREFFGSELGDELHMLFNFMLHRSMYLALAAKDVTWLAQALRSLPALPPHGQWLNFARTHDELTLAGLSAQHQEQVRAALGTGEDAWIFGRGIPRRLPSLVAGDRARLELIYSLLFSLPGAPMILWGEEIGMGDNPGVPGRLAVRTPMQWSDAPNAGFSQAPQERLVRPLATPPGGPDEANVVGQRRDPDSLLNWFQRLTRARKTCPEIGWGDWEVLETGVPQVLAVRFDWRSGTTVVVHNLDERPHALELKLPDEDVDAFVDLVGEEPRQETDQAQPELRLGPYGYRWLRARRAGQDLGSAY